MFDRTSSSADPIPSTARVIAPDRVERPIEEQFEGVDQRGQGSQAGASTDRRGADAASDVKARIGQSPRCRLRHRFMLEETGFSTTVTSGSAALGAVGVVCTTGRTGSGDEVCR